MADPYGLLRSRAMANAGRGGAHGAQRRAQVGRPADPSGSTSPWPADDIVAIARRLRAEHAGLLLPIPANYYDDLEARHDWRRRRTIRELGLLYDRDEHGEFLHLYTVTVGRVFFEIVQRTAATGATAPPTRPSGWPSSTHAAGTGERAGHRMRPDSGLADPRGAP